MTPSRPRTRPTRRELAEQLAHRRDIARRIDIDETEWDVMFGPGSWLFWAFPRWRAPRGLILSDADPSSLLAQMRQAETVYGGISALIRRGGEVPPPGPRHHGQQ